MICFLIVGATFVERLPTFKLSGAMLRVLVSLAACLALCHGGALHRAQGIGKPQECAGRWVAGLNRSGRRFDAPIASPNFGTVRGLFGRFSIYALWKA